MRIDHVREVIMPAVCPAINTINVHNGRDNSACKSYGWVMLEVFFGELVGDEISGKGKLARVFSLVEIDS